MIKINQKHEKEIIALNTFEAVRLRPTMYLGQISLIEDKNFSIIRNNKIQQIEKTWSPGFMHLIVEILENSLDEAKRMKGKMKEISITINLDNNEIIIIDQGGGFHKAVSKHKKTKKSIIRTAFEELHAGSNFKETEKNILGTHGVGSAVVNILSETFYVDTTNKTHWVQCKWDNFKLINETKGKSNSPTGTKVSFIPSKEIFPNYKWDLELIQTYLSYKAFLISLDPKIKNLKLKAFYIKTDENLKSKTHSLEIFKDFIPDDHIRIDNKELGTVIFWEGYPESCSISFVNGSLCSGIHQKIINDWCNKYFNYNLAHHFYETLVSLNVPSYLMRFADQNKSKFATSRLEIEPILKNSFQKGFLRKLKGSELSKNIFQKIEDKLFDENIRKIKRAKRIAKRKFSEKYSPASKKKHSIYITEGLSSAGSIKQARDSKTEGVYALKGKVKNTKHLKDLTDNKEILEIMSVLNIEPGQTNNPAYENIIIATDMDYDGEHITALLVNFFYKWFPYIISNKKLYKLITPLVAADHGLNRRKYFYTLKEFEKYNKKYKLSNIHYLKGLGSLSSKDWEFVMNNKILFKIEEDKNSYQSLDIAFGDSSQKRKKWLSS